MIDLDASIEAGKTAAGLSIGDSVRRFAEIALSTGHELGDDFELLELDAVRVWVREGFIVQIGVRGAYGGRVGETTIGVGSTIRHVEAAIGPIVEDDEDNLIVVDVPGLSFETEAWRHCLDARVTEIFVFASQSTNSRLPMTLERHPIVQRER